MRYLFLLFIVLFTSITYAQTDQKIYDIIAAVSEDNLRKDVQTLVNFGTRHTLSDTISETRGIGAARRWIKSEFETISKDCNDCLRGFLSKRFCKKRRKPTYR